MAVTPVSYVHKGPAIEVVKFDTSSVEVMEDVRDWVIANLLIIATVTLMTSMGGMLYWEGVQVRPNEYVVKDGNGNLFKMTKDDLDKFFDEV